MKNLWKNPQCLMCCDFLTASTSLDLVLWPLQSTRPFHPPNFHSLDVFCFLPHSVQTVEIVMCENQPIKYQQPVTEVTFAHIFTHFLYDYYMKFYVNIKWSSWPLPAWFCALRSSYILSDWIIALISRRSY